MDIDEALTAFGSLSQETRLRVFRLLVEYGPAGSPAGKLSTSLHIPHNTLSFHLSHMSHAGLVLSRREGRSVIYSANFEFFSGLIRYMVEDCCRVALGEQLVWDVSAELFDSWTEYAVKAGEVPGSKKAFGQSLQRRGFEPHRFAGGVRGFYFLRLKAMRKESDA